MIINTYIYTHTQIAYISFSDLGGEMKLYDQNFFSGKILLGTVSAPLLILGCPLHFEDNLLAASYTERGEKKPPRKWINAQK